MLALTTGSRRRQALLQLPVMRFRISVSICQPLPVFHRLLQFIFLQFACAKLAGIDLPVRQKMADWTKLHANQPLAIISAQVKYIIEGKPAPSRSQHAAAASVRLIEVDADSAGQRLDNFLLRHLKGVPKTHVYRIIRSGEVRVNKGRASAETRVQAGDAVRVPPVRISDKVAEKAERPAPAKEFPALLDDESMIAIDKPAGVAVHGGSGVNFGVIEQLRQARPEARFLELVHRLDRETSGILLVAKKRSALVHLQDQFRERETGKTYLALVQGAWPANKKVIDVPLHKYLQADGERRVRVTTADDPDGMRSITLVRVRKLIEPRPLQGLPAMSLLEVTIKTGRTHQIRVHLSSQGHPIVGDDKYGDFELNRRVQKQGLKRMFLHAWRLQFMHPASGERLELRAELPPELADFVA
jgi:23S rRNA pseudouridine955/2504/2580 synthase